MERSEQIHEIAAALSKAQGEYEAATKDSANPHFKSRYADLASGMNACRDALSKNGIAVVQSPMTEGVDGGIVVHVSTHLVHSSGQWLSNSLAMPCEKTTAQAVGSAITYARRYALFAMVGIAPEDDDGNAASERDERPRNNPHPDVDVLAQRQPQREAERKPPVNRPAPQQLEEYKNLAKAAGLQPATAAELCQKVAGCAPASLTVETMEKVLEHLRSAAGPNETANA